MRRGRALGAAAAALALVLAASAPVRAQSCRLALLLALDVSSSVDAREYALQTEGLAQALEDPEVREAILIPGAAVAMAVYEWSGRAQQEVVADWALMAGPADIDALAARIRAHPRSHADFPTALGHALGYGAVMMGRNPGCAKRTIDVSGDGANNDGYEPFHAYNAFAFGGVTVNALVVAGEARGALVRYFRTLVIRGPDAFVEVADGYGDYARVMRRKLLRELRLPMILGRGGGAADGRRLARRAAAD